MLMLRPSGGFLRVKLLLYIKRSQLRWFKHVTSASQVRCLGMSNRLEAPGQTQDKWKRLCLSGSLEKSVSPQEALEEVAGREVGLGMSA